MCHCAGCQRGREDSFGPGGCWGTYNEVGEQERKAGGRRQLPWCVGDAVSILILSAVPRPGPLRAVSREGQGRGEPSRQTQVAAESTPNWVAGNNSLGAKSPKGRCQQGHVLLKPREKGPFSPLPAPGGRCAWHAAASLQLRLRLHMTVFSVCVCFREAARLNYGPPK